MSEASKWVVEAAEFYAQFQATRSALTTTLEIQQTNANQDVVREAALEVAKLRKSLVDATTILTAYDQRQCEAQMTTLECLLEEIRTTSAPKPKFAFKRKTNKSSAVHAPSTSKASVHGSSSTEAAPSRSTFHTLSSHTLRYLTSHSIPTFSSPDGTHSDLTIANLDHCVVNLCSITSDDTLQENSQALSLTALHISNIRDSVLILPAIEGSVLLHDLTNCVIVVGCHQFRMHRSTDVYVYLSISSNPIIEHCSGIVFTSYPTSVASLSPQLEKHLVTNSTHAEVQDFSHIRSSPSPNWSLCMDENASVEWEAIMSSSNSDVDSVLGTYLPKGRAG